MLTVYLLSGAYTLLLCGFARRVGPWLGVMDLPDGRRKLHPRPTPLVGGLSIVIPAIVTAVILGLTTSFAPLYIAIAAASLFLTMLGYLDDRGHIRAAFRLALSAAVFLAVFYVVPGLSVRFLSFSIGGNVHPIILGSFAGVLFSVVCLVGLQNAVNMADGKNGLVIGLCLIWTIVLFGDAPPHVEPLLLVLVMGLAIALAFNVSGRIFLGDAGTYGLSALIGLLTLYTYNVGFVSFPADAVALMFLIPVLDTLRLMVSRALKGRSPSSADRDHLHHILLGLMPWHWALATYLLLVGLPTILSRFYVGWTAALALASVVVYALVVAQKYRSVSAVPSGTGPA